MVQEWRIRQFGFDGFDGAVSSGETQRFGYDNQQQEVVGTGLGNFSGTTGPLGLTLTKTPSFLELVESQIFKKYNTASTDESSDESKKQEPKKGETEKIKASKIMALGLRIGCFERVSKNDEDVVAKCHYARRKLVWEILHRGLKYKIEIKWSEISAIRAVFPKNQPSKLEIQLSHMPSFHREDDNIPRPRNDIKWSSTDDFTENQASTYRTHCIQFCEGELEKHYERLLQCDGRLLMLSQRPFPNHESPFSGNKNKNLSGHEEFAFEFIGHQPGYAPAMQYPHINIQFPFYSQTPHMFQTSCRPMNAVHLNSSLPPYMMGRENQVMEQQPLYAYPGYPNQADHAFPTNASHASNFQAVEDYLLNGEVAPVAQIEFHWKERTRGGLRS